MKRAFSLLLVEAGGLHQSPACATMVLVQGHSHQGWPVPAPLHLPVCNWVDRWQGSAEKQGHQKARSPSLPPFGFS